jgi:hypothetical protein
VLFIPYFTSGEPSPAPAILIALSIVIDIFVYFRYGLLMVVVSMSSALVLVLMPITVQPSAFYFKMGLTGLTLLLAFVIYAFRTSLGGRPIFGTPRLDE